MSPRPVPKQIALGEARNGRFWGGCPVQEGRSGARGEKQASSEQPAQDSAGRKHRRAGEQRFTPGSPRAYSDHPTPRKIELLAEMQTTWDGLPIAREPPYACAVVIWRQGAEGREFLLLHRLAPGGAGYDGEWAWTPPSGARQPGEAPDAAATREVEEEIGLMLALTPLLDASASEDVAVYVAQAPQEAEVVLDDEHDRFVWLPLEEALPKCLPPVVASGLANAAAWIEARSTAT